MSYWNIDPGTTTTRAVVSTEYGGATQGGIQPSARTPNVLLYSDPAAGAKHGYRFDGFGSDGAYYYTGEGQEGNQQFIKGNRAILNHAADGRALRLFEARGGKRPGGKQQVYLGEFTLDEQEPSRMESVLDSSGGHREVIVFRLLSVGAVTAVNARTPAVSPTRTAEVTSFKPVGTSPPMVTSVAAERNVSTSFPVLTEEAIGIAERHEAKIMATLERLLEAQGHRYSRRRILPPGETAPLITDTFDDTAGELFEIKPGATRSFIREAVAQLLDYRRHLPSEIQCTVLVPVMPSDDLRHLINSAGLRLAVLAGGELSHWEYVDGRP